MKERIFILDGGHQCAYTKDRSGEVRKLLKNCFECSIKNGMKQEVATPVL